MEGEEGQGAEKDIEWLYVVEQLTHSFILFTEGKHMDSSPKESKWKPAIETTLHASSTRVLE